MSANKMKEQESLTIQELFSGLDTLIAKLEKEDVSLEESFQFYQKGMDMLKLCNDKIDKIEKKILVLNEEGELHEFE